MKKLLLATTAVAGLVAFTPAANAEIDLSLGGYFQGYFGYVDQDTENTKEFDMKRDAQVQFHGETALDNGLIIGAHAEMQLEADDTSADQESRIEESYIFFSSEYGRINLGAEDGAAYLLQVAAPAADANVDGFDPNFQFVNNDTDARLTYKNAPTEDADKITYITPKISGFQGAVSYASSDEQRELGNALDGMDSNNDVDEFEDIIEAALRYDGSYENVGMHVGVGYTYSSVEAKTGTIDDERQTWNAGFAVDYAGFGLGFNYLEDDLGIAGDKDKVYFTGLDYKTGAYKFGASWLSSEHSTGTVKDTADRYSFGAQYAFGPGMTFNGSVNVYDIDDATVNANDNEAVSVLLGTDIAF